MASHTGYREPVRVPQPQQEDPLAVERAEAKLHRGVGHRVDEGRHHDKGGAGEARLSVPGIRRFLAVLPASAPDTVTRKGAIMLLTGAALLAWGERAQRRSSRS